MTIKNRKLANLLAVLLLLPWCGGCPMPSLTLNRGETTAQKAFNEVSL